MEAVLGKGWEVHVEGQKLKQDGEAFRQKLNTQQLFEDWKKKVKGGPVDWDTVIFPLLLLLK